MQVNKIQQKYIECIFLKKKSIHTQIYNLHIQNLTYPFQWGQFVDHDITHTPTVKGAREVGIICCGKDGKPLPKRRRHRDCFPVEIPENDR